MKLSPELIDGLLIVLVALFALRGLWRGLFRELFNLAGLILGFTVALLFAPMLMVALQELFALPEIPSRALAFVGLFVGASVAMSALAILVTRKIKGVVFRTLNSLGGFFAGGLRGAALVGLLLTFFHLFPALPELDIQVMSSQLGSALVEGTRDVVGMITRLRGV